MALPASISVGDPGHISDHEEIHALLDDMYADGDAVARDQQGTLAARPAAGQQGRYYYATDTGLVYRDDGSQWVQISPGTRRSCRLFKAGVQSITNGGSGDDLDFGAGETYDPQGMHTNPSANVTTGVAGWVTVAAQVTFDGNATGIRMVQILLNGNSKASATAPGHAATGGISQRFNLAMQHTCTATDTIRLRAFQNSGSALDVLGTTDDVGDSTWLEVTVLPF